MIDPDLAALQPGYLERRREDCAALRRRLEAGDFAAIRDVGHRFKGSGATYGFPEISDLGRRLEQSAAAGDPKATGDAIAALEAFVGKDG